MKKQLRLAIAFTFCFACFAGTVLTYAGNNSTAAPSCIQSAMVIEQYAPGENVTIQFDVYFPLDSYEIDPKYMGNAESLKKLADAIKTVGAENISSIDVVSKASPEGPFNRNNWLAQKRSEAVKAYFAKNYPSLKGKLKTQSDGEAWDELRDQIKKDQKLSESTKSRIYKVIDNPANRKQELKEVLGSDANVGDVYEYLFDTYYPYLRKSNISVESPAPKKQEPVVVEEPVVLEEEKPVVEEPVVVDVPVIAEEPVEEQVKVAEQPVPANMTKLTGRIVDAVTKEPLPGVRVEGFGNNRYTSMTGEDGTFSLNIPEAVTSLYVSTPGYNSVVIPARQPEKDIEIYDEIFSAFAKNEFDVTAKASTNVDLTTVLSAEGELQRKLGADVRTITRSGTPGMGALMLIQGVNSLNTSAQPLVVLDGVIQDLQDGYSAVHEGFFNNILAGIDVDDIDNISVLKNGTAFYGAKGANGVILINTKRGHSMATRIDVKAYGGYTMKPLLPQMMNASQYRTYANELMGGVTTTKTRFPFLWNDPNNYYYNMYHNETNWSDYVYRGAWSQNYKVNVQGGDEAAMYNFSLGYSDAQSTVKCNDFNRLNIRFNTDIILSDKLKTRFDIAFSRIARDLRNDGIPENLNSEPISSPGFLALIKSPFLSPYKYSSIGTLTSAYEGADVFANFDVNSRNNSYANPLSIFEFGAGNNKNNQEYTVFDVTIAPEWSLGKGFTAYALFNYTLHRTNEKYFRPLTGSPKFYIAGLGYSENEVRSFFSKESSVFGNIHLDWTKRFGDHTVYATAGSRFSNFAYDSKYQSCHNTGNDKLPDISAAYDFLDQEGLYDVWRNLAYYVNADYNYRNKYFLQGTLTAETSSRFGRDTESGLKAAGVCWGIFPGIQAGWLISAEPWFSTKVVDFLKLTAGFEQSGNDNVGNNAAFAYFGTVKYQGKAMGLSLKKIGNQSIQWETTNRANVGLETVLFNNRVKINTDFYHNVTNNLLTTKTLNSISGIQDYWCNGGSLENNGFDVNVLGRIINTKNWKWELGASAAHYRNAITSLPDGDTYMNGKDGELYGYTTSIYDGTILTAVGQPVGVFYGYATDGVYSTAEDVPSQNGVMLSTLNTVTGKTTQFGAGDVKFINQNNDNVIDEKDRVIIGNPNPDLFGNIISNLSYRHFTLSAIVNYVYGNDVYNYQRSLLESGSTFYNQTVAVCNRWQTEGDVTSIPKTSYGDPIGNNRFSDRWIEDGSYLRLRNLTLSYKVPVSLSWLQGLTVWCEANNLFTLTNYLGSDPEFSFSNNVLYQGIDAGLLGQSRSFHLGMKINL